MGCLLRVSTEKNAQCESCELNFIGGQNEDSRWEIAFQITLGNCSKAVGGTVSISDFGEMGGTHNRAHISAEDPASFMKFTVSHEGQI